MIGRRNFAVSRQCAISAEVTDIPHDHALTHLSAAETRLSAALARPRRIARRLRRWR